MLPSLEPITDVARAIQLALAPVFLLTGIAGLLNVMAGRLSRIIDRGRALTENPAVAARLSADVVRQDVRSLERRRRLTSVAIAACTVAALLLCVVVAALFFEALFGVRLGIAIGLLFTGATLALIVGLAYFLREVHLATRSHFHLPVEK
jgi:hypothetical protein